MAGGASGAATGTSRLAATGIPAQVIIGAERDLEKVKLPTNLEFTLPGAKTVLDSLGKARAFLMQMFDDTCGVVVGESMARDGGADHLTEAQAMTKAYRDGRKAYRAGAGMNVFGMERYLKSRGAQTIGYARGVTIAHIEAELARGGQVAVMINTASPGKKPFCHWVRVIKIERGSNGWPDSVIYGDPWTGTQCRTAACVFRSSMIDSGVPANQNFHQFGVVFAMW